MMTSSNGNIFRLTVPLCREFPGHQWIPQRLVMRSFDVFFDLCLNIRLGKQLCGWWFETSSRSLWRQCNGRYSAAQHNMSLRMLQKWLRQNTHQRLYSQKTPHISPSRASYGVSFVRIWVKIDRVITAPYCIFFYKWPTMIKTGVIQRSAWWLQITWRQISTSPSLTVMLIIFYIHCKISVLNVIFYEHLLGNTVHMKNTLPPWIKAAEFQNLLLHVCVDDGFIWNYF